jgi:hypothetical protein
VKSICTFVLVVLGVFAFSLISIPSHAIVQQQWVNCIATPYHSANRPYGIGSDSLDNVYICGDRWRAGGQDFYFSKFNSEGELIWTTQLEITGNISDYPPCMTVDRAGNTYLGANCDPGAGSLDFLIVKVNPSGQVVWTATYNSPTSNTDYIAAIALDTQDNLYVLGGSRVQNGSCDWITIKYNTDGVQQWMARSPSSYFSDSPFQIAVDAEGNSCITGKCNLRCRTVKYNSQGVEEWTAVYDPGVSSYGRDLALDLQGNVYVTGILYPVSLNSDAFTIKYDPFGVQQWIAIFGGTPYYEWPLNLETDPEDNVIVEITRQDSMKTMKYDSNGLLLWTRDNGFSTAHLKDALVLDPEGNIYVTGSPRYDFLTTACATYKYNPSGDLLWVACYDTSCWVEATEHIALSESGNVMVTGWWCWPDYLFSELQPLIINYSQPDGDFDAFMVPTVSPVVIPAQGGSFNYNLQTFNIVQNNLATDFWGKVIYPPPLIMIQTLGPVTLALPLDSASFLRTQRVPGNCPAGIYQYILYAGDFPGIIWATDTILVTKLSTGNGPLVEGWENSEGNPNSSTIEIHPSSFILHPCVPNPFNPSTALSYKLQAASHVSLKVYDTAGRLVTTLVNGWREVGTHEVTFDGSGLASGIYLYTLTTEHHEVTGKMVLLK